MNPEEVAANYFRHLQRGQLLMDVERWREALHEFHQHLSAHPDDYHALCQTALCHLQLKEFQQAFDTTKRAIEVSPESEWAYRLQSIAFTENGEPKRALEAAKICIQKAPYAYPSVNCLFWAQANYGDYDEAEKTLQTLLELAPGTADALMAAAYIPLQRKNYPEAERLYLEALKLEPESINALNNLGVIYLDYAQTGKGRHYKQKSIDMFERAVKLEPTFKLGQKNMSNASNALKFGLPAGGFFLVWIAFQLVARFLGSFTDPGIPAEQRRKVIFDLSLISPSTPSFLLTGANIFFIVVLIGLIAGLVLLLTRHREAVLYQLMTVRGWLIPTLVFGSLVALYLTAFWILNIDATPFSGFGLVVSFFGLFFSGINVLRVFNSRRSLRS